MDHSPQVPADDRALRLLEHANLPPERKEALIAVAKAAQHAADDAGKELQAEFGKDHVALIVGCNQFVRLFRGGPGAGSVELLLDEPDKKRLADAGHALGEPEGMVFKLFGWVRVSPKPDDADVSQAVEAAFAKALKTAK